MFNILLLFIFLHGSDAVRYRLTEEEYARMPPLTQLDPYEACQQDEDALYCMSEYMLVSDKPSELLDMIQEYSDYTLTHYNHTKLRYGVCVKQSCQKFYDQYKEDVRLTLEACLNASLSEKYDLKVKLLDVNHCRDPRKHAKEFDQLDFIVGAVCVLLLLANIAGTICEYNLEKDKVNSTAVRYLLCFSVQRNWKKLMAPAGGQDPRLDRLKSLNGLRVLTICLMIFDHSIITPIMVMENPDYLEKSYSVKINHILMNGHLIMQTFLIISAFLLIYNSLIYSEKHPVSWTLLPKYIIFRWLRLTPSYGFVLALTTTWFAHFSSGPFWNQYVEAEMRDCRLYWWQNILYINNYTKRTECMGQCWYLAADTQLYCLAVLVFLFCRTARSKKIVLSTMFAAGVIIPAFHVYLQDLDGALLTSPEAISELFVNDPYFVQVYTRTHTNFIGYAIGISVAYLVYHWQKKEVDVSKYRTPLYRILFWSLFPLGTWCCYIGGIFYDEGPRYSVYVRTFFTLFRAPLFSIFVSAMIIGLIFQVENLYRGILEWRGWTQASRLCYGAYLMHTALVRTTTGRQTTVMHVDEPLLFKSGGIILAGSFITAALLWLLVEKPFNNLTTELFSKGPKQKETEEKKKVERSSSGLIKGSTLFFLTVLASLAYSISYTNNIWLQCIISSLLLYYYY